MLGVGHPQHDPAAVFRGIDVADGVPEGLARGAKGVLARDEAVADIEPEGVGGGIEEGDLHLLADPRPLPDEQGRHDAGQEAQGADAVPVTGPGDLGALSASWRRSMTPLRAQNATES